MILQIVTFGLDRFWNRRRLRHRFDLLSISALCGLEIASCCFSSPPDSLLHRLMVDQVVSIFPHGTDFAWGTDVVCFLSCS